MIQYECAKDSSEKRVHIKALSPEKRHYSKFTCIECGNELIPRLGEKNAHHFYHKSDDASGGGGSYCKGNSYLHTLAVFTLYHSLINRRENKQSLFLSYTQKTLCSECLFPEYNKTRCLLKSENCKIDLLKYPIVVMEEFDRPFKPDIMLSNDAGDKIYIEIVYSNKVKAEKASSGIKIVEIFIDNEKLIQSLELDDVFDNKDFKTNLYNFNQEKYKKITKDECVGSIYKFIVYLSGKSILKPFTYLETTRLKNKILYEKNFGSLNEFQIASKYVECIEEAYKNNISVSHCHLCMNHTYAEKNNYLSREIFCNLKNEIIKNGNDICDEYSVSEEYFYSKQKNLFLKKKQSEVSKKFNSPENKYEDVIKIFDKESIDTKSYIDNDKSDVIKFVVRYDSSSVFVSEPKNQNQYDVDHRDIVYSKALNISAERYKNIRGKWKFSEEYINEVMIAAKNKIEIKSCYLCKNHDYKKIDDETEYKITLSCSMKLLFIKEPNRVKDCKGYSPV